MTWTYRVMRVKGAADDFFYGIFEYYKKVGKGGPAWSVEAIEPHGETFEELKSDYEHMAEAFKQPVLNHSTGKPIVRTK